MFSTPWVFKEILNVVYVSVVCKFAASKHHHCCGIKVTMLVLLHVAVVACKCCACVSAILSHVAASKSPHYYSVNVAMLPLLYVAVIVCKSCVCVCHCLQCCKCHHCGGVRCY